MQEGAVHRLSRREDRLMGEVEYAMSPEGDLPSRCLYAARSTPGASIFGVLAKSGSALHQQCAQGHFLIRQAQIDA